MPINNCLSYAAIYKRLLLGWHWTACKSGTHMPQNKDMCFRYTELHTSQPICHGTKDVNLCCNIAKLANCSIRGERCTTSAQASHISFFCNPATTGWT